MSTETCVLTVVFTIRQATSDDHPEGFTETEVTKADIDGVPVTANTDNLLENMVYRMVVETEKRK